MRALAVTALVLTTAVAVLTSVAGFRPSATTTTIDREAYDRFLERVRNDTRNGDSILILAPAHRGTTDYDYAFFRASYVLAGRTVLPAVVNDQLVMPNLQAARFAAVWRGQPALQMKLLWRAEGGELWQR